MATAWPRLLVLHPRLGILLTMDLPEWKCMKMDWWPSHNIGIQSPRKIKTKTTTCLLVNWWLIYMLVNWWLNNILIHVCWLIHVNSSCFKVALQSLHNWFNAHLPSDLRQIDKSVLPRPRPWPHLAVCRTQRRTEPTWATTPGALSSRGTLIRKVPWKIMENHGKSPFCRGKSQKKWCKNTRF